VKQRIKSGILALSMVLGMTSLFVAPAGAINVNQPCTAANKDTAVCKSLGSDSASKFIQTIINTLLFIIGAISVIMIIVGGIRYVLSNGNSSQINSAKDTVLYAVIGLIVALLAYAIVGFVINQFK
jgi:hypothetical protein